MPARTFPNLIRRDAQLTGHRCPECRKALFRLERRASLPVMTRGVLREAGPAAVNVCPVCGLELVTEHEFKRLGGE